MTCRRDIQDPLVARFYALQSGRLSVAGRRGTITCCWRSDEGRRRDVISDGRG